VDLKTTRWEVVATRADDDDWGCIAGFRPDQIAVRFVAPAGGSTRPDGITLAGSDGLIPGGRNWAYDLNPASLPHCAPWLVSVVAAARDHISERADR
jgi:hypothetical protein